jgi:uncharacterized DUF497 family protein
MVILGFDWDETNRRKLELHDLAAEDVEDLFELGRPYIFKHPKNPSRHVALGFVPDERFVLVVCEYDKQTRWVRVVTAYEPSSEEWWKTYSKAKGRRR